MAQNNHSKIKGDRALQAGDEDRLRFRQIAARIATSLVDHASDGGLVIGINGSWGTGKSSLLYLIEEELAKFDTALRPTVINFRPWLVGHRDTLLASLFSTLSAQINKIAADAGDGSVDRAQRAKAAAEALRKFTEALGRFGSVVEFAGDVGGFAPVKWFGKGMKSIKGVFGNKPDARPLADLKDDLVRSLKKLGHRFIITIDDVDRLEPSEVIEVLRLVRSVADFPNVIYLMCYDSEILAHSIKKATKVKSGKDYLEKIVQLTIMVPAPEAFELRQWFTDDLFKIVNPKPDDDLSRLRSVIDYEGGRQLKTPRAVVRALDSIRFFWPPLREEGGDLADLVWLQLIKDGNPELYRWIERYLVEASVFSLGTGIIADSEKDQLLAMLLEAAGDGTFADSTYRYHFAEHLPGMDAVYAEGGTFSLLQRDKDQPGKIAIRDRRLASPDHYRLYFALAAPAHTVTGYSAEDIAEAAEAGSGEIRQILLELHKQTIGTSVMGQADVLLERFKDASDGLSSRQSRNLLIAFSLMMDEAYRVRPFDLRWMSTLWDRASSLVPVLLKNCDSEQRKITIIEMFSDGAAINWLTNLLRREIFAHGIYGDQKRSENDWLLLGPELELVTKFMLERYRLLTRDDFLGLIDPPNLLFAWRQGGDEEGPRALITSCIEDDDGLVATLEILVSTVTSSHRGTYSVLTRDSLDYFLDFDNARQRVSKLATDAGPLTARALKLAAAFDSTDLQ